MVIAIVTAFTVTRTKHKQRTGERSNRKRNKVQGEFELQPRVCRKSPLVLWFHNPYYDVLAAMGLDDDLEEEFCNPLYDDVSMYSDTTDDSCHECLSDMVIR